MAVEAKVGDGTVKLEEAPREGLITYQRRKRVRPTSDKNGGEALRKASHKERELDIGWKHGEVVDGNKFHWMCNWCGLIRYSGGVSRLKKHLAGGFNVRKCRKVPDDVAQDILNHLIQKRKEKDERLRKRRRDHGVKSEFPNKEIQGGSLTEPTRGGTQQLQGFTDAHTSKTSFQLQSETILTKEGHKRHKINIQRSMNAHRIDLETRIESAKGLGEAVQIESATRPYKGPDANDPKLVKESSRKGEINAQNCCAENHEGPQNRNIIGLNGGRSPRSPHARETVTQVDIYPELTKTVQVENVDGLTEGASKSRTNISDRFIDDNPSYIKAEVRHNAGLAKGSNLQFSVVNDQSNVGPLINVKEVQMADHQNGNAKSLTSYAINLENFSKRLKGFYTHWRDHKSDLWGSSDAIAIATPPASDDLRYLKSSALNIWLLGYEFPETIMVFMNKQIHFLCSQKKASLLETLKKAARESVGAEITVHVKAKNDDGIALMDSVLSAMRSQSRSDNPTVGYISKEAPEGKLLETWSEKLHGSAIQVTDVTNGFSELFAVKDTTELTCVKKAAYLTSSVMKSFVVPKLEKVIDEEKKISHASLMDSTEKAITEPATVKVKLKAENVDICYPPIFQSGGKFDLRPSASSNDDDLYYDSTSVIICAIGSRYNSYCTNVARTFLIDAVPAQSKAYEVLLKAHDAAVAALKPGNTISAAYLAAHAVVEKEAPELLPNLTKSAGTGMGLEFRESGLSLNAKNDRPVKSGMVFNVSLGFQNLQAQTTNPKTDRFSLLLADTVIVGEKTPEVLTASCSKAVKDVAYSFNDEEEDAPEPRPESTVTEAFRSKATLRSDNQESKEELRRQHQAELARQKNEETARRLAGVGSGGAEGRGPAKSSSELVAYKNVNDIPYSKELGIQVDQKNEAILLPIYGSMVPFHVSTVKSVTSHQDNRTCTIRIIFNVPGTPFNPHDANTLKFQGAIYLKEVTFRSRDPRHSSEVVQLIKTLRRQVASRESERAERATLVTQEKLVLAGNRMKPIRLQDLWIRPPFGGRGRKLTGTLEAHVNGFRYSTSRPDERVDVMYANIKHAFFQPAEREMITLLHFHLHNHIMVGNRKTKDVQFYIEVMDVVQTLGSGRRSALDPDEIEEEQRERDRKNRINMEFQNFVNKVHDHWSQPQFKGFDLEFDMPVRELGFHGVPHKASAFIVPTSTCLVELIETPFLVVTLNDIEIVNLERVGLGQKNFDMTIVFKDFKRDVLRIDSIPSSSLDAIKEWLDTTDLKYYESRVNLSWRLILKTIIEDPEKFIEDGGWEFLNLEASDSESDNTEESDRGYEPSDVEPESASEEEESDSASLVESDEEDDSGEDSEEEKGKTWEELEREASNADRERGDESDSEDEKRRRKTKAIGKSRAPDRRDSKIPGKRQKF